MSHIELSLASQDDRRQITGYTVRRFGVTQARRLRNAFEQALRRLAESPELGKSQPEIDPPGRSFRYFVLLRTFIIVYEPVEDGIRVARLIHGARDLSRELDDDPGAD